MKVGKGVRSPDGADIFARYPLYTLVLSRPKELPKSYPVTLVTIGDHIRKKRIDLGLFQRQVAEIIGVCEHTIYRWENGTEPEFVHIY